MRRIINTHKLLCWAACLMLSLPACHSDRKHDTAQMLTQEGIKPIRISLENAEASGPYLTYDHLGKPVLCWTEKINEEEGYVTKFALFEASSQCFGEPTTIIPSRGTRAHPESMNKVAFKEDGTVVALYAVKQATEENPFAGSIFYTLSTDFGKNWSDPTYLHSDTLPTYGRSFFDLATLPDGEVGAIWLDGRFAEADTGSALFFAKTVKGKGFGVDRQIGESTCECCRTDIFVDEKERIHVAYRDILFPPALVGQQVRDMAYSFSDDGGNTFSPARRISADNWAIEGCPHTGPSLASNQEGLHVVWFTAGGDPGVYYSHAADYGNSFAPRQKISEKARHPQVVALPEGALVMVWNESQRTTNQQTAMPSPQHQGMHAKSPSSSQILLQRRDSNGRVKTMPVTTADANASYPVVIPLEKSKVVMAWRQEDKKRSGVYYKVVDLEESKAY